MKKLLMPLYAIALCLASYPSHAEPVSSEKDPPASEPFVTRVSVGDVVTMSGEGEAEISNPTPIKDKMSEKLSFGDSCYVEYKGTLTVVGVEGSAVLAEYKRSPVTKEAKNECPNGALLLLNDEMFGNLMDQYARVEKQRKERLELVKRILEKKK